MALDEELLDGLRSSPEPILHLYDWQTDAATYGHFIDPAKYFDMQEVQKKGLDLAKRPTGGGIVFHITDLAFSVLIPSDHEAFSLNSLDNYIFINQKVKEAIASFISLETTLLAQEETQEILNFCMAKPTIYDVMIGSKKVGGAAQRKTKYGYLHQGSIFIAPLDDVYLQEVLQDGPKIASAIKQNSLPLLNQIQSKKELCDARVALKELLIKVFKDV